MFRFRSIEDITMKKKNFESLNEENFLQNKNKRKSRKNAPEKKVKKNHNTAIIVSSVLLSILVVFISLFLFVPSFKTTALKHVLSSLSTGSNLENAHNADNSVSDGIHSSIISSDGKKGSLTKGTYTFLALGVDHSEGLTDVIMVARFDTSTKKADILQIPRDTYVKLNKTLIIDDNGNISKDNFGSSGYEAKINSTYSTGRNLSRTPLNNLIVEAAGKSNAKIKELCESKEYSYLGVTSQTLSKYLNESDSSKKKEIFSSMQKTFGIKYLSTLIYYSYGIPIDYYAQVNTSGFRNIVDAVGGVDLYVPQNMYHNDPTQNLLINLKKGQQHLDGDKAEQFVRFRGYAMGDIDRVDAQKTFINAFLNKLLTPSIVTRISDITKEIQKNLFTNLSLQETADFALLALDLDLSNGFTMTTLPGRAVDATRNGVWVSYYSANKNDVMELVNKSFNKYDTDLPAEMFGLHMLSSEPSTTGKTVTGADVKAPVKDDDDKSDDDGKVYTTTNDDDSGTTESDNTNDDNENNDLNEEETDDGFTTDEDENSEDGTLPETSADDELYEGSDGESEITDFESDSENSSHDASDNNESDGDNGTFEENVEELQIPFE